MLKKAKAAMANGDDKSEQGGSKEMGQAVLDSSRHIWLAGLGAFSRAQAEGMKMFETLVKQGEVLEGKTRRAAVDTAAAARGAAQAKVKEVKQGVGGTWDKLEQVFEDRVARALSKLGVHTQNDVLRLSARVDRLSEAVNELIKATGVSPARKARAKAAPKAAAKAPAAKSGKAKRAKSGGGGARKSAAKSPQP